MRISVTAADIRTGQAGDCRRCPLALALRRATGDNWVVLFASAVGPSGRQAALADAARRFRRAFDDGRPVAPFEFDAEVSP